MEGRAAARRSEILGMHVTTVAISCAILNVISRLHITPAVAFIKPSTIARESKMGFKSTSTLNDLMAGSVGGAAQVLVGQPLDTVKTRAQIAPSSVFVVICCSFDLTLMRK